MHAPESKPLYKLAPGVMIDVYLGHQSTMQCLVPHYAPIHSRCGPAPEELRFDAAMQFRPIDKDSSSQHPVNNHRPDIPS